MRNLSTAVSIFAVLACAAPVAAQVSQAEEEKAVIAAVEKLFEGMRQSDTTMIRSVMSTSAQMFSLRPDQTTKKPMVHAEPPTGWMNAVANNKGKPPWDERLYNPEVRIDGRLATVWVEYDLYVGPNFVHCGVDAIQMLKMDDGWKVVALSDTRKQQGCPKR